MGEAKEGTCPRRQENLVQVGHFYWYTLEAHQVVVWVAPLRDTGARSTQKCREVLTLSAEALQAPQPQASAGTERREGLGTSRSSQDCVDVVELIHMVTTTSITIVPPWPVAEGS